MQYYLNGFKPGDPTDFGATDDPNTTPPLVDLPEAVGVLIVGCGPAGLLLSEWIPNAMVRKKSEMPVMSSGVTVREGPLDSCCH